MSKTRHYCTYFDIRYLQKGLLTYESLRRQSSREIVLWILCLDEAVHATLTTANLPGVRLIRLGELELADRALAAAKSTRTLVEYYFTCTPCLPVFILDQNPDVADITYIDGDLYFFADPELVYSEIGDKSIGITPHRFSQKHRDREKLGLYNVAFNFFRRNEDGVACLNWWRERCIEWCYDRMEDGKFADQKYLNDWPTRFQGVKVLDNPGINLAPWNVEDVKLSVSKGKIHADGSLLIFYHFHALIFVSPGLFNPCWENYTIKPSFVLRFFVYQPYVDAYSNIHRILNIELRSESGLRQHVPRWVKNRTWLTTLFAILHGRLLVGHRQQ
jgi:hypothetical protein